MPTRLYTRLEVPEDLECTFNRDAGVAKRLCRGGAKLVLTVRPFNVADQVFAEQVLKNTTAKQGEKTHVDSFAQQLAVFLHQIRDKTKRNGFIREFGTATIDDSSKDAPAEYLKVANELISSGHRVLNDVAFANTIAVAVSWCSTASMLAQKDEEDSAEKKFRRKLYAILSLAATIFCSLLVFSGAVLQKYWPFL